MRRAKASISSVVVRPLPHSRAIRRKGALVMAAMGASRHSSRISMEPIFMGESGRGPDFPTIHSPSRGSGGKLLDAVHPIRVAQLHHHAMRIWRDGDVGIDGR